VVPLSPTAENVLRDVRTRQRVERLMAGSMWQPTRTSSQPSLVSQATFAMRCGSQGRGEACQAAFDRWAAYSAALCCLGHVVGRRAAQSGLVAVELIQPDDMPPIVRIGWPLKPTIVDPQRFPDTAVMLTRLFATAAIELASKKAKLGGRCHR
jgi:hypothetical protein